MQCGLNGAPGRKPQEPKEKASAFRRWQVTRAYSPHPEPPVLRVEAIIEILRTNRLQLRYIYRGGKNPWIYKSNTADSYGIAS